MSHLRSILGFAGLALASLLIGGSAFAQTSLSACVKFEILDANVDKVYDPYKPHNVVDNFTVRATRASGAVTSVRFLLVDTTPLSGGPKFGSNGPADYDIDWVDDSGRPVFVYGAETVTTLNSARIRFGQQSTETTKFRLSIPRGQTAIAGRQIERLAVRYQCYAGNDEIGGQLDQYNGQMELSLYIPRMVSAYIGGIGQQHGEIAFGTLGTASNLRKNISVSVMSTLPYAIDISSENGLKLLRGKNRDGEIDYKLQVAGLDVTDEATMQCPVTPMPSGESRLVEVALDPTAVRNQPAGDYSDTITLTFRPNDGYSGAQCRVRQGTPTL